MGAVVVERRYDQPISLDLLGQAERGARWCFDIHDCRMRMQSLTSDGLHSLCVYDAPDAEALRRASDTMPGWPAPTIWSATTHFDPSDPDPGATTLEPGENGFAIVDRSFPRPVSFAEMQALEAEKSSCLTMHRVRFLRSLLSLDGKRMACVYAAPDTEAVRNAVRATGLPYDSVRPARAAGARDDA